MSEKQTEMTTETVNPTTGEVTALAKQGPQTVEQFLKANSAAMAVVCPPGVKPEKVIKTVAVLVASNEGLRKCTPKSIFLSVMRVCELGLSFNPALGEAYLVPRGDQATPLVGYRGMAKLARESGEVTDIEAHVVREGDDFDYALGLVPRLEHVPSLRAELGAITHAYAIARLKGGGIRLEVMGRETLDLVRAKYAAKGSQMWELHYDEAASKTVMRRICKKIPMGQKLADAIAAEDDDNPIVTEDPGIKATASLKERMAAKAEGLS
jgi:recombination protein RecT